MAISVDWATGVITVPQADLTFIGGTFYELDTDVFRKALKALEAGVEGMVFPDTHIHNTEVTVAGTTFFRTIEIIAPYSVQFTPDSQWSVRLVGSNNNIFDVENGILVQNQVQVIPTNSAGGTVVRLTGVPERATAWSNFAFNLVLSSDHASPATGKAGTITVRVCKDDGAWQVISPTITEVGLGQYRIDLTATDMDFETGTLMVSEPDVDPVKITIRTAGA